MSSIFQIMIVLLCAYAGSGLAAAQFGELPEPSVCHPDNACENDDVDAHCQHSNR